MRDLEAEARNAADAMRRAAAQMTAETQEQRVRCESMQTVNHQRRRRLALKFPGRFG